MGHEDVAVLNGGLKKWKAENRPTTDEPPRRRSERHFTARFNAALVRDLDDVKAIVRQRLGADRRCPRRNRFRGEVTEPRKGLRSGHMPGAMNVPFAGLLRDDGTLKPGRGTGGCVRERRRRPAQADHGELRLGRHGRRAGAGAGAARASRYGGL